MKYTNKVEINLPLEKVVHLWENEDYFKEWQTGFINKIQVKGTPGEKGAQSEIYLNHKNREMKLLETVLESNLPHEKIVLIEHEHMSNTMASRFKDLGNSRTEYAAEIEYIKFNGFLPTLMAKLFPGMFKQQSQMWLDQFKSFAEGRVITRMNEK